MSLYYNWILQCINQKTYYISDYLKYKIIDIFLPINIYLDDFVKLNIHVLLKRHKLYFSSRYIIFNKILFSKSKILEKNSIYLFELAIMNNHHYKWAFGGLVLHCST